jgi:hypothetical protein
VIPRFHRPPVHTRKSTCTRCTAAGWAARATGRRLFAAGRHRGTARVSRLRKGPCTAHCAQRTTDSNGCQAFDPSDVARLPGLVRSPSSPLSMRSSRRYSAVTCNMQITRHAMHWRQTTENTRSSMALSRRCSVVPPPRRTHAAHPILRNTHLAGAFNTAHRTLHLRLVCIQCCMLHAVCVRLLLPALRRSKGRRGRACDRACRDGSARFGELHAS